MGGSAGAGGAGGSCEGCVEYIAVRARYSTHAPLVSAMGPEPGAFVLTTNINAPASATREANPGATPRARKSHPHRCRQPRKRPRPGDAKRVLCRRTASLTGEAVRASWFGRGRRDGCSSRGVSNTSRSARRIRHTPARPAPVGPEPGAFVLPTNINAPAFATQTRTPAQPPARPQLTPSSMPFQPREQPRAGDAKRMRCRRTASLTGEAVRTWASRPGPAGGWLVRAGASNTSRSARSIRQHAPARPRREAGAWRVAAHHDRLSRHTPW